METLIEKEASIGTDLLKQLLRAVARGTPRSRFKYKLPLHFRQRYPSAAAAERAARDALDVSLANYNKSNAAWKLRETARKTEAVRAARRAKVLLDVQRATVPQPLGGGLFSMPTLGPHPSRNLPLPSSRPPPTPGTPAPTRSATVTATGAATGAAAGAAAPGWIKRVLKSMYGRSIKTTGDSTTQYGMGKGLVRPALMAGGTAAVVSAPAAHLFAGSLKDDMPLPDIPVDASNSGGSSSFVAPVVGASTAGLGSLLYGKLKDKPNLQRDLIATLLGGTAGIAYNLMKSGADADDIEINARADMFDKEALGPIASALIYGGITAASFIPMFMGKGDDPYNDIIAQQKALARSNNELNRAIDKSRRGVGGAVLGGSLMGLASNLYGMAKDKKSLKRDLLATVSGTILGGAAGVYTAS